MRFYKSLVALILCLVSFPALAVLEIQITQGIDDGRPIAIIPFVFEGTGAPPVDIAAIVRADLQRSGSFSPMEFDQLPHRPAEAQEVDFEQWRQLGQESLLIGKLKQTGGGEYAVSFELFETIGGRSLLTFSLPGRQDNLRRMAHQVADMVYETLTGIRGAFNTSVAYIDVEGAPGRQFFALEIADSDGHDAKRVLSSTEPLLSPAWSPDGARVAYVSFENGRPEIFVQHLEQGSRIKVSGRAGLNSAPAWSPRGDQLVVTLSPDGDPDLFLLRLADQSLTRLTDTQGIDTEPAWSPDGQWIYFTSDRSGQPQIYRVPAAGGRAVRISFEGNYNAAADVSPDGRHLALVHGMNGQFRIAVMDLKSGVLRVLTDGGLDESPSFAPNGSMIIYATESGGRGVLAAVSRDGRYKQELISQSGNIREPVWSPFPAIK